MCNNTKTVRRGIFECASGDKCHGTECFYVFYPYARINTIQAIITGVTIVGMIVTLLFLLATAYGVVEWPI